MILISNCCPNTRITYPEGSRLCRSSFDCFEGQYCGFVPGYTAAVCRGEPLTNRLNIR